MILEEQHKFILGMIQNNMTEDEKLELAFLRAGVDSSLRKIVLSLEDESYLDNKNSGDHWKDYIPLEIKALWTELNYCTKLCLVGMAMLEERVMQGIIE